MGNDSLVLEALYHEVIYMVLTSLEITSEESAWMDRAPVKSDLSVPKTMSVEDRQGAETDESSASPQSWLLPNRPYSEEVRLAMRQAEAQEYGLIEDDSGDDPLKIPDDILAEMGISPEEVGQ